MNDAREAREAREEGFASAFMIALLALAGLLCVATADVANVLTSRARAQVAADAAALAAAAVQWERWDGGELGPVDAARAVAGSNGARLDACSCDRHDGVAAVEVSIATRVRMLGVAPRRVSAQAEAELDVGRLFEPSS